eukprot:1192738-Prorocentrum_minimum.AAC.3
MTNQGCVVQYVRGTNVHSAVLPTLRTPSRRGGWLPHSRPSSENPWPSSEKASGGTPATAVAEPSEWTKVGQSRVVEVGDKSFGNPPGDPPGDPLAVGRLRVGKSRVRLVSSRLVTKTLQSR